MGFFMMPAELGNIFWKLLQNSQGCYIMGNIEGILQIKFIKISREPFLYFHGQFEKGRSGSFDSEAVLYSGDCHPDYDI